MQTSGLVLTWWACCRSSILSWRIWQSYSRLFLSICRLNFSTAVLSSSCCLSLNSSPNLITVSCCRALYKVASSSWILWQIESEKSNFGTEPLGVVWGESVWMRETGTWCLGLRGCQFLSVFCLTRSL